MFLESSKPLAPIANMVILSQEQRITAGKSRQVWRLLDIYGQLNNYIQLTIAILDAIFPWQLNPSSL